MRFRVRFFLGILLFTGVINVSRLYAQHLNSSELNENAMEQLRNFQGLLQRYQNEGNKVQEADYYNKIAYLYLENGSSSDAVLYFNKSVEINKSIGNENALQAIYTNIGTIYFDESLYNDALKYFNQSLHINRKNNKKRNICENLINLAFAQGELKKHHDAVISLEEALELATELKDMRRRKTCVGMLSENYNNLGDLKKAQEYLEQYTALEGKLHQDAMTEIERKTVEVEKEKQKTEQKLQQTSDNLKVVSEKVDATEKELDRIETIRKYEAQERELEERERKAKNKVQFTIIFCVIGILIIILLVIYINYKRNKKINALLEKQNKEISNQRDIIETANKNITNSINYAKRIQKALLPPVSQINSLVPESFIFFEPRDIVSGDFYWFSETKIQSVITRSGDIDLSQFSIKPTDDVEDGYIISAIDCTGHGVPGAFMSMIGYNLINEIISYGVVQPDKILKLLNHGVRNQLKQKDTDNRDGMDMAICLINKDMNRVEYAGAKNPLVYIKNNEIFQIKGDFLPIGGFFKEDDERGYTRHVIEVDEPTTFYIFSDGFADQMGGESGRKFLSKFFRSMLLEISSEPVEKQPALLKQRLTDWMGGEYSQIDDILVIGFKLYPKIK